MTDTEPGERVADVNDWELVVLTRVHRARDDLATVGAHMAERQRKSAGEALDVVEQVLRARPRGPRRLSVWWTGWRVERAWRSLHEAEVYITAADPELVAHLPALRERVAIGLPTGDLRRAALD